MLRRRRYPIMRAFGVNYPTVAVSLPAPPSSQAPVGPLASTNVGFAVWGALGTGQTTNLNSGLEASPLASPTALLHGVVSAAATFTDAGATSVSTCTPDGAEFLAAATSLKASTSANATVTANPAGADLYITSDEPLLDTNHRVLMVRTGWPGYFVADPHPPQDAPLIAVLALAGPHGNPEPGADFLRQVRNAGLPVSEDCVSGAYRCVQGWTSLEIIRASNNGVPPLVADCAVFAIHGIVLLPSPAVIQLGAFMTIPGGWAQVGAAWRPAEQHLATDTLWSSEAGRRGLASAVVPVPAGLDGLGIAYWNSVDVDTSSVTTSITLNLKVW